MLEKKLTIKSVAERMGTTGTNLSNKLRRDNLSDKELREIANALDCDYEAVFIIRDTGKRV